MMSLEERTLVVRNFCDRLTKHLFVELFTQAGPVINVVLRTDFAFVEFEHKISVGYALALLEGIHLFGFELHLEPKLRSEPSFYSFKEDMDRFNHVMVYKPDYFLQFMPIETVQRINRENSRRSESHQWSDRRQSYPQRNRYSDRKRYSDFRDF